MKTATMCFTCREPIETKNGEKKMAATFLDKFREVCTACGEGIHHGDAIFQKLKVSGECLADVKDNHPPIKI